MSGSLTRLPHSSRVSIDGSRPSSFHTHLAALDQIGRDLPSLDLPEVLLTEKDLDDAQQRWYAAPDKWYFTRDKQDKKCPVHVERVVDPPRSWETEAYHSHRKDWSEEQHHELQFYFARSSIKNPNAPAWQLHEEDGISHLRLNVSVAWQYIQNFPITTAISDLLDLWHKMHTGELSAERAWTMLCLLAPVSPTVSASNARDVTESIPTATIWFADSFRLFRILYNAEYLRHLREFGSHEALLEWVDSLGFDERTAAYVRIQDNIMRAELRPLCMTNKAAQPHLVDFLLASRRGEGKRPAPSPVSTPARPDKPSRRRFAPELRLPSENGAARSLFRRARKAFGSSPSAEERR
ncbi:hypothetical protein JCM10450v2_004999 [Rhodotorula kratochvilovae]